MMTRKFNQLLVSLGVTITLLANAYPQASRTVMVQSNTSVLLFPTNLWSANAASARSGLSLATHATNPIVPVTSGGSGATNVGGARTNLGLGATWLTNTDVTNFRTAIGLGDTNDVNFGSVGIAGGYRLDFAAGTVYDTTPENTTFSFGGTWYVPVSFSTNTAAAATRTNLGLPLAALTNTSASSFRAAISLGATWLTNTNITNLRTAVGLGSSDSVSFGSVSALEIYDSVGNKVIDLDNFILGVGASASLEWATNQVQVNVPIVFYGTNTASTTRTNLGLPLAALTNNSNVTMMRALSGSTNTNHPYSGSISVIGTNNTNTLTFSNGILQSVQ